MTTTLKIDFTGQIPDFHQFSKFGEDVTGVVRKGTSANRMVVVDWAVSPRLKEPVVITDHLNLAGWTPLVGPNHPCGKRFPVVNDIYVDHVDGIRPQLKTAVAAGLRHGIRPAQDDLEMIGNLGADVCCYNLVPTMIVAAHAGYKVLALLLPEGSEVSPALLKVLGSQ